MGVPSAAIAAIKNGSRWELTSDKVRAAKAIDEDVIFVSDIESLLAELTDRHPQEPDAVFVEKMPHWETAVSVSVYPSVKKSVGAARVIELCQKYGHVTLDEPLPKHWEKRGLCCGSPSFGRDVVYDPVKVQKNHKHAKANARRAEREGRLPYKIYGTAWHALGRKVKDEYGFISRIWGPNFYTFIYQYLPGLVKCLGAFTDRFRFKPYVDFLKAARPYRHGILMAKLPKRGRTIDQRGPPDPKVIKTWQEFGKWLTAEIHAYCAHLRTKKAKKGKEGK